MVVSRTDAPDVRMSCETLSFQPVDRLKSTARAVTSRRQNLLAGQCSAGLWDGQDPTTACSPHGPERGPRPCVCTVPLGCLSLRMHLTLNSPLHTSDNMPSEHFDGAPQRGRTGGRYLVCAGLAAHVPLAYNSSDPCHIDRIDGAGFRRGSRSARVRDPAAGGTSEATNECRQGGPWAARLE